MSGKLSNNRIANTPTTAKSPGQYALSHERMIYLLERHYEVTPRYVFMSDWNHAHLSEHRHEAGTVESLFVIIFVGREPLSDMPKPL
jgi:hypothetical protein